MNCGRRDTLWKGAHEDAFI